MKDAQSPRRLKIVLRGNGGKGGALYRLAMGGNLERMQGRRGNNDEAGSNYWGGSNREGKCERKTLKPGKGGAAGKSSRRGGV